VDGTAGAFGAALPESAAAAAKTSVNPNMQTTPRENWERRRFAKGSRRGRSQASNGFPATAFAVIIKLSLETALPVAQASTAAGLRSRTSAKVPGSQNSVACQQSCAAARCAALAGFAR
jgi:hypothetical protein